MCMIDDNAPTHFVLAGLLHLFQFPILLLDGALLEMADDFADVFAEAFVVKAGAGEGLTVATVMLYFVRVLEIDGRDIMIFELGDI